MICWYLRLIFIVVFGHGADAHGLLLIRHKVSLFFLGSILMALLGAWVDLHCIFGIWDRFAWIAVDTASARFDLFDLRSILIDLFGFGVALL